jgi:uncharacterized protein (TIGR03437 family)
MRPFRLTVLLCFFLFVAAAQITLNPTPTRVIGQTSTTLNSLSPNLVEGREFLSPESVVVDVSTNPAPVYVADTGNNRVLGFRSATGFANGQFADIVIGQPDLVTTLTQGPLFSTRTTGLTTPEGMAVDSAGNLYVIDAGNNRILSFPKPFSQTATVFPDIVIGQPTFATGAANQGGLSATSLSFSASNSTLPASLAIDASGNLWVADAGNNRILRFNATVLGVQAASGPAADLVLGQPDFVSNGAGLPVPALTSFTSIQSPTGIAFDAAGRLFVSESVSGRRGRVLVWFPGFSIGQSASRMLGVDQTSPPPATVSEFQFQSSPGALFAVGNQIGVSDTFNNRILLFPPVEQWNLNPFFQAAIAVVGQTSFAGGTANQGMPSAGPSTLSTPVGAFFFNSELYVADTANHRMIVLPQAGSGFGAGTRVLGQLQLTLNSPNLIQGREFNFSNSGSAADAGIAVDFSSAVPHLYVSDPYNNRVLGFYDLRNIQPGQYADIVIGQPDFLHSIGNYPNNLPASNNLSIPTGLAVDSNGNLYVADTGNARVLRFPSPFANFQPGVPMAVTESADLLLGQPNFTTKITDATSQTMAEPYGLALDGDNGLLVSDLSHNRVLFFAGKSRNLTSFQPASIVFGQSDMNSSLSGSGLNQMNSPHHIAVDTDDRLYVADTANGRVTIFNRAPAASNGAYAALTLTSGLSSPRGIDVNPATGDIWVADANKKAALRYSDFNTLIGTGSFTPNTTLSDYAPLAVAEDNWGNIFLADDANRVVVFYPGLSALNAANFLGINSTPVAFPLAPGLITALYSTGNTGQFGTASVSATTVPLPKQLNGVQVLVNNTPAPLFYAGTDQINFVVPANAPQNGTADVQVVETATGRVLGDTTVVMFPVSPGVFTQTATGSGAGVIANQDGTLNTPTNPAAPGSIVTIYLTGQGYISGMPADGAAPSAALSTPYTPTVYVGGANFVPPGNVKYSGLAPEQVGVWQINVQIPNDAVSLPASPTQVLVQVDSLPSGGGALGRPVYIYIK